MTTAAPSRVVLRSELVNNVMGAGDDWAKVGKGRHLEPGVVKYDAVINPDGSVKTPERTYLLTREAIAAMRASAVGKPIIGKAGDFDHMKVNAADAVAGKYDGDVIESYDGGDGWEWIKFLVRDPETKEKCREGYQFSCAYIPTQTDDTPGKWHNVAYDAVILNAEYTHFAVVPTPRYAGATIELENSLDGGIVNKTIKGLLKALLPAKELKELANAMEADEQRAADAKTKKEKAKADFDNAMKNAASDEEKAKAKDAFEKANAEADASAADQAGAADDAEKKNAQLVEERKNKVMALRNAADAVEKAMGPEKAKEYRNEADQLEKLPLGGGDVVPDPGVTQAGLPTPEEAQLREKALLEKKNADEAAAKLAADEEAKKAAALAEKTNALLEAALGAAWPAFAPEAVEDEAAKLVLVNSADQAPLPYASQPAAVKAAWKGAYVAAPGASADEKRASLAAKAKAVVELKNAVKAKAAEAAKQEAERTERFNALRKVAEERGGLGGMPALGGDSMEDKANLGAALYG